MGSNELAYDNQGRIIGMNNLSFFYDETGVQGIYTGSNLYYFKKDAQGNIIALLDSQSAVVVKYV